MSKALSVRVTALLGISAGLLLFAALTVPALAQDAHCLKVLEPLAQDSVPLSANFTPAPCPVAGMAPAFHHDRALHATRLARALVPDEIVPAYPEYGVDMVAPGQTLHLVVTVGAAHIDREVEALQPARPGQRLFVRDADGQILSVRYEEHAP